VPQRLISQWLIAFVVFSGIALASPQRASAGTRTKTTTQQQTDTTNCYQRPRTRWRQWTPPHGTPASQVPELDPTGAASALTLLLGAGALVVQRSARRKV